MNGPELISCVVPVFDGEGYLAEAIDSILAQTYRPLEVIVVDDGSTDGSAALAGGYGPPVRVLRQPNQGGPVARNTGIQAARGELVAFLDADDVWRSDKLARQMHRFTAVPDLDICLAGIENFWEEGLGPEEDRYQAHGKVRAAGYAFQTMLARRSVFDRVGPVDPRRFHGENLDWFMRARAARVTIEVLPEVLAFRRMHPGNVSRSGPEVMESYLELIKESLDRRRRTAGA